MKWGSTDINFYRGSYQLPACLPSLNEIQILPDPSDLTNPATILQQGGRTRKRVSWRGFVTSRTDYDSLLTDQIAGTERILTDPDGKTMTCVIEDLVPERVADGLINYSITLLEA